MTNLPRRAVLLLMLVLPRQAGTAFEPQRLEPGLPVTHDLSAGETHAYTMTLAADQFAEVRIEQRGVDVTVTLFGPDGSKRTDANSAKGSEGAEALSIIADTSGDYRVDVRPAEKNAVGGRYAIILAARRAPTADERTLEDARRQFDQSRALRDQGKYDEAIPPAERAIALREQVRGKDDLSVADALHLLAVLYDDKNEYAKAEAPNLRALAIREQTLGPDHPDVARSLFNLAWLAKVKQDYAQAEVLYRRALSIQERALGPDHTEVATTLNDLAILYDQQGRYDDSIQVVSRVLAIREKAQGPESDGVARSLNNLARVYEAKGDYLKSQTLLQRSAAIWEKVRGPDHPDLAFALDGLAKSYFAVGDYAAAEPLFLQALAIREKALGPDHPEVGTTLNNLSVLYRQKGDYALAERLSLRDLALTEKRLGPKHAFLGPTLTNLAAIAQARGEYEEAARLSQRALAIYEASVPNHVNVGLTLNRLAQVYALDPTKTSADVETAYRRALAFFENAVGPDYPAVASSLSGLAAIADGRGDRTEAERLLARAVAVQEKSLGPDHPDVAASLETLAGLRQKDGDTAQALSFLSRASDIRERHLAHNLSLGSERQKLGYLKLFERDTDRALALHSQLAPGDAQALRLAMTTLLRRKGRALDAASDNVATLRLNASPQDQVLFDRLSAARSRLAAVTLRGPSPTAAGYQALLDSLRDEVERLEADIGARSAAFRAQSAPITLEAVRATIPDDAALIEFAAYHVAVDGSFPAARSRYAAYVLPGRGEPQWVDLGEVAEIDRAVETWREALGDPARNDAQALGRTLDAKLMQPLRAQLGAATHLLISPDGALNLIPFAALVDERQRPLIERYRITYLTSGRDLLRLQIPRESRGPATIVAAPAFGDPAVVATQGGAARVDYSQVFFGPLPGVSEEVRALEAMLPQATVLVGAQATEDALRHVSGPRLLHIATHGFFLRDSDGPKEGAGGTSAATTRIGKWVAWADNPLLRSGLALAGANQGRSGDDDGVLTAMEAAGLDLWGTKLVVLSACDTGIGEVRRGDGVYGLRRALVLAGAESQLMSLWPVSDRSTRDLMIGYYKQLTQGEGRGEALRQAQLRMLRDGRHGHPYYWASFIQSGEWAPLERKTKN